MTTAKLLPLAAVAFLVVSCASWTPEQALWTGCRAYVGALNSMLPFKANMTMDQIGAVAQVVAKVEPVCLDFSEGAIVDENAALEQVRSQLPKLRQIESEVVQ